MKTPKRTIASFCPAGKLTLIHPVAADDPSLAYAVAELQRLLKRLGVTTKVEPGKKSAATVPTLALVPAGSKSDVPKIAARDVARLRHDGYVIQVAENAVVLAGRSGKALLNAVYDLAEQFGIRFLVPGDAGEFIPAQMQPLPLGTTVRTPRFAHRGVFWQALASVQDYSVEEWLRFYAKLRFNAVTHQHSSLELCRTLGLRLEVGEHGFAKFLPRDRFAKDPDMFRMFQPEDFGGKRVPDANLCVGSPKARAVVAESFRKELKANAGVHAIHAWADDLPAGGWCQCPTCRAFTASDQALIGMRLLADTATAAGSPIQVPMLVYHDTIPVSREVKAAAGTFLLYAPRERCYGHALGDPRCERNRLYLEALHDWMRLFGRDSDAHTFEYYFDQILFRGMYPFLPDVIFADLATYHAAGIETSLSLQVAGPEFAPEYNMLAFSWAHWEENAATPAFLTWLTASAEPADARAWQGYLNARAKLFTAGMCICGHQHGIYLDYRWLPESTSRFAQTLPKLYADTARGLAASAKNLARKWPTGLAALMKREDARVRFEAIEFEVMAQQQAGSNALAEHLADGKLPPLRQALAAFARAVALTDKAQTAATKAGLEPKSWYQNNINRWLRREMTAKIERFQPLLKGS